MGLSLHRDPIGSWKYVAALMMIALITATTTITTVSALSEKENYGTRNLSQKHSQQADRILKSSDDGGLANGRTPFTSFDIPPFAVDLILHYRNPEDSNQFELEQTIAEDLRTVTTSYLRNYMDYMTEDKSFPMVVESIELNTDVVVLLGDRRRKEIRRRRMMEMSSDSLCVRATFDGTITFKNFNMPSATSEEEKDAIDEKTVRDFVSLALVKDKETSEPAVRYSIAIRNSHSGFLPTVENILVYADLDIYPIEQQTSSDTTTTVKTEENNQANGMTGENNTSSSRKGSVAIIFGVVVVLILFVCMPYVCYQYKRKQNFKRRDEEYLARQNAKVANKSEPDVFHDGNFSYSNSASEKSSSKYSRRSGEKHFSFALTSAINSSGKRGDDCSALTASSMGSVPMSLDSARTSPSKSSRSLRSGVSDTSKSSNRSGRRIVKVYDGDQADKMKNGTLVNDDSPPLSSHSSDGRIEGVKYHNGVGRNGFNKNYESSPRHGNVQNQYRQDRATKKKQKSPRSNRVVRVYEDHDGNDLHDDVSKNVPAPPVESAKNPISSHRRSQAKIYGGGRRKSSDASVGSRTTRSGGLSRMSSIIENEEEEEDEKEAWGTDDIDDTTAPKTEIVTDQSCDVEAQLVSCCQSL